MIKEKQLNKEIYKEKMENNKLIAEFMGEKFHEDSWSHGDIEYKTSWGWLMPVVEKIESLDLSEYGYTWEGIDGETEYNNGSTYVEIERNKCWIYMDLSLDPPHYFNEGSCNVEFPTKLEATYAAVVEFIEYYNTIKQD